jgi:dihydrofolate reductase
MGRTVLYMSMSLDGFITGPDDDAAHGLGVGGERLHAWLAEGRDGDPRTMRPAGPSAVVFDEMLATGAVLSGRRTFEAAGGWSGDHHDGVAIVVPTHRAPDVAPSGPAPVTFVTDGIESAVARARAAAGDRNVLVHGADTAQRCLRAGLLDELEIQLIPVLLARGRPLFAHLGADPVELEVTRVLDAPGVTHLRYRVRRA